MDLLAVFYILLCGTVAYGLTSSDKDSIECTNGDGNYPIPGTCDSDFYFCYNDVPYLQVILGKYYSCCDQFKINLLLLSIVPQEVFLIRTY